MHRSALVLLFACASCRPQYDGSLLKVTANVTVRWSLVRRIPHTKSSFTEGLVFYEGFLFESSGGDGASRLLKTSATDGHVIAEQRWPNGIEGSGVVPFAEGLALVDTTLIQLSWKNERALTWARDDFKRGSDLRYDGQGWGLCYDGTTLWRTDGSSRLRKHDKTDLRESPNTSVEVTLQGKPVRQLNELECIDTQIFANVWQTPYVVIIQPSSGLVTGVLDLSSLVDEEDASGADSVLNGLAWDPQRRVLYVTGKNWSHTYVLQIAG